MVERERRPGGRAHAVAGPHKSEASRDQGLPTVPPLRDFLSRRYAASSPFWSWLIFERIGGAIACLFAHLGLRPAPTTLLGGACGISGALALGVADSWGGVALAGALLLLAYSLDCADGQLARATGKASAKGAWLDVAVDGAVIAFVSMSVLFGLLRDGDRPFASLLIAAAFGASRSVSLFTSTIIRRENGGMRLSGFRSLLRTSYTAAMDTPFVYVVLCATRQTPSLLRVVLFVITALTVGQFVLAARHHFAGPPPA